MYKNIAIIAAKKNPEAIKRKDLLVKKYGFRDITLDHKKTENADLVIAVGGDGLMLHLLHEYEAKTLPIYGVNCGTVGFLMNSFSEENFLETLNLAQKSEIHPLRMKAKDVDGKIHSFTAINEVSLLRQTHQAAKIKIEVNGHERIECLIADGALISTAAGSTAYNSSVGGPIIPLGSEVLALTPISPFRPKRWHGALLPSNCKVKLKVLDHEERPTSATADSSEVRNVVEVEIFEDKSISFTILFNSDHSLEERIIREQFRN
jgi:NAD+ kinase